MKAIITINYTEFLVSDAKKALALVEMLQKAQVVVSGSRFLRDEVRLSEEVARVEMCVVPTTAKIIPAKAQPKKKEP